MLNDTASQLNVRISKLAIILLVSQCTGGSKCRAGVLLTACTGSYSFKSGCVMWVAKHLKQAWLAIVV